MKTRIITAIVAICVLLPVLIFSDTVIFPIALAILSLVALYEMASCIGLKRRSLPGERGQNGRLRKS